MKLRNAFVALALLTAGWLLSPAHVVTQNRPARSRPHEYFQGRSAAAGEVLVKLRPNASTARIHQDVDAEDDRPVGRTGWRRLRSFSRSVQTLMSTLSARADVIEVEPNYVVSMTAVPNDPLFPSLPNLWRSPDGIAAPAAWDITTGSANYVVGVIDTGVEYGHPDLAANMWSAPAAFTVTVGGSPITCPAGSHGFNAITFSCDPADDHGHGTHTSGTIGAVGNNGVGVTGVNWTTRIMGLKFLDASGNGFTSDAVDAIEFAIQAKAYFAASKGANVRVLSNSWGGGGFSNALLLEIQAANTADMLFVAAAGNSGANNDAVPFYPASMNVPNVVAVAATQQGDVLAGFSNYGATSVDLAAPGVEITSTFLNGTYGGMSGTSMATPHVAGVGALVLSACSLTTAQLKAAILNNVDVIPAVTGLVVTNGRLNANRAVRSCATVPTVSLTSPADNSTYLPPATIALAATASDPDGISRVEFYRDSTLIGTATSAPFTGQWSNVPAGLYALTAKAFDTLGVAATSAAVHVTVTGSGGPRINVAAAAAGGVAVASSTANSGYPASAAINGDRTGAGWGAGGGWNDGTADAFPDWLEVDFNQAYSIDEIDVFTLQDNYSAPSPPTATMTFTGFGIRDFNAQYWTGTAWQTVPGGQISGNNKVWRTITFPAVFTNRVRVLVNGAQGSYSRIVEVEAYQSTGAANTPPTVALTSPAEGASYAAPASIGLAATASDTDGIKRVDFYENGNLVGSDATSPYTFSWTTSATGNHTLTAVAVDNLDLATTSAAVHVTVTGGAGPRTNVALASAGATALGSSTANSNYPASATINGDRKGVGWGAGGGWNDGTAGAFPDWLEVDFSGAHTIDEIDVFTLQDNYTAPIDPTAATTFTGYGLRDFDVQYWDGVAWQLVAGGHITGNTNVWRTITFPAVSTTRVRIFITNALAGYSRIVEVEAYESGGPANAPPTVSLTGPTEGASVAVSTPVGLAAMAADPDGTVKRVDFYVNGTFVGSDATDPYAFTWTPAVAGPYTLTAVATDNLDVPTTSAAVHVTVTGGAASRTNVALATAGATAVASSTANSNYPASAAINGDRKGVNWGAGGGWNDGTPGVFPDWLEVDFSGAHTIDEIDVFTLQDNYGAPSDPTPAMTFTGYGLRDFDVQYWDGANWQPVAGGHITANTNVWRTITFPAVSTTRIRVLVSNALTSYSRIVEVEAYEVN